MSSSVLDIWNLALSHLGDIANVSDPDEQSEQADKCRRYYPICLNLLLEAHSWAFATRRAALALAVDPPATEWLYAYAVPSDMLKALAVLPEGGLDNESVPYIIESLSTGDKIVYTNYPNVTLRYTALIDDTTKFSAMFTVTLTWLLASYLAGPILKGTSGVQAGQSANQVYLNNLAQAKGSDASQQQNAETYVPQGIRARFGAAGLPPFGRNFNG